MDGFLGLACLFASFGLGKKRVESIAKISLLANGFMIFLSGAAYVFNISLILALFRFIGLGAAILVESLALCAYFKGYSSATL